MHKIVYLFLFFWSVPMFGQPITQPRIAKIQSFEKLDLSHAPIAERDFFKQQSASYGLANCSFKAIASPKSKTAYQYTRYQQYYQGLEVIGGRYILHTQDGKVLRGRGKLIPDLDIKDSPTVSLKDAFTLAEAKLTNDFLNNSLYINQVFPSWIKHTHRLVIIGQSFPKASEKYALAYELKIESDTPYVINETVYVDAHTGNYISHFTNVHSAPIETDVQTFQYGKQTVTIEEYGPDNYGMIDSTRNGNQVIDSDNGNTLVQNTVNDFDTDNGAVPWAAADAHYCTEKYHDFMLDHFEWDGVDGIGGAMLTRVNQGGKYYVNATWNGTYASFGNGNCDDYYPLTILDVVGHEYAHGFVDFTSDLVYQDQSGALNESTADIFGKSLERIYDEENFSWNLALKAARNENITGFRSMEDPFLKNDPKAYGGQYWYTGAGDREGVHTNSGVMNYWYYLLVEGGSGTNEFGYDFDVQAIGLEDALQIVYHAHLSYLTVDSDYFDAMYGTIEAAADLYGDNSQQQQSVIEAWMTANLFPGMDNIDLSIVPVVDNISICESDVKEAQVIIRNVGTQMINSGNSLKLNYNLSGTDYEDLINLTTDFNPGDSILYTLVTEISGSFPSTFFLQINLSLEDDLNTINNLGIISIRGSQVTGMDTQLTNFSFTQNGECGIPELTRYAYTIQNLGCTTLNAGDSILIHVDTGDEILTFERTLFFSFEPGNYQGASINLPEPIMGNFQNFTASIEFKDYTDIRPENNSTSGKISYLALITNGYYEDFSPVVNDSLFFIYSSLYRAVDTIYDYNGNHVLAFTGQRRTGNYNACEDLDDFYDDYNYVSYIRYCADTEGMDRPFFSFDLTQFRNSEFDQDIANDYYQTIVRVVTDSTAYDYIYGLDDGVPTHIEYELPQNYQGKIEIQAITLTGYADPFLAENEGLTDAALIDNIHLFDKTEEEQKFINGDFLVYPNPTSDFIKIESKYRDQHYEVFIHDQLGRQILHKKELQFRTDLDLSSLSSAVYFLTIVQNNIEVNQQKIVVTR